MKLSYTRLSVIDQCELKYAHRYVWRTNVEKDDSRFILGASLHNAIEKWVRSGIWYKDTPNARENFKRLTKDEFEVLLKEKPHSFTDQQIEEELERALSYVDKTVDGLVQNKLLTRKMEIEKPYSMNIFDSHTIYIRPDLISWKSPTEMTVVDYKSNKNMATVDPLQLEIYATVYAKATGLTKRPSSKFFFFMNGKCKDVEYQYTSKEIIQLLADGIKRCINVAENPDTVKPTKSHLCRFCDYRFHCPIYEKPDIDPDFFMEI